MAELRTGFDCHLCGEHHPTLPLSFSVKYPLAATDVPPAEARTRVVMNQDQCVIYDRRFFLRGRVLVPVHGLADAFIWGIWAEVSPRNFLRTQQLWTTPGREAEPPFPGWLDNELALYGTTVGLPVQVHTQTVGRRPHFVVTETGHPLAGEQRAGITLARVQQIAAAVLHGSGSAQHETAAVGS